MSDVDDDCLHCELLSAITKFKRENPDICGCVECMLDALASVIGDQLSSEGSTPYRDEFMATIHRRIQLRLNYYKEERR